MAVGARDDDGVTRAAGRARVPRDRPSAAHYRGAWSGRSRPRSARPSMPGCAGCRAGSRPPTAGGSRRAAAASARRCCRRPGSAPTCRTACSTACRRASRRSSTTPSRSTRRSTCRCCRPSSTSRPRATGRAATARPRGSSPSSRACRWTPSRMPGAPFLFTIAGLAEEADAGIPALPPLSDEAKAALRQEVGLADDYANMIGREVCAILLHHRLRIQAADQPVRRAADRGDARRADPLARRAVRPERADAALIRSPPTGAASTAPGSSGRFC